VTGRWELPKPSAIDNMTEEQKEYEAMELVKHLDKLQRLVGLICRENDTFSTNTVTYFDQSMPRMYDMCVQARNSATSQYRS
jgi:hypothetical protein